MTGLVVRVHCQALCNRWVAPSKILNLGPHVGICEDCWQRHLEAQALLTHGVTPKGCQNCNTPHETLKERARGAELSYVLHHLDGVYVAICPACNLTIVRLQRHQTRDTPFGAQLNL